MPAPEAAGEKFTDPRVRKVERIISTSSSPTTLDDFVIDYEQKHGRPFIADLLDAPFLYNDAADKAAIDTIDAWVMFEIDRRGLAPRKASYQEIIDTVSRKIHLSPNTAPDVRIRKIAAHIKRALHKLPMYSKLEL